MLIRGIYNRDFISEVNSSVFMNEIKTNNEFFIGIRSNALNIYYKGGSFAKVSYSEKSGGVSKLLYEIAPKYFNGYGSISGKYIKCIEETNRKLKDIVVGDIRSISDICQNINAFQGHAKSRKSEKIAQQEMLLQNNSNKDSNWYCVDMEYNSPRESSEDKQYGRFDIIAVSKNKMSDKKFHIALIELKCGTAAYGGSSGIKKHIMDYFDYFERIDLQKLLIKEVVNILHDFDLLKINQFMSQYKDITEDNLVIDPFVYIITVGKENKDEIYNQNKVDTFRCQMIKYLKKITPGQINSKSEESNVEINKGTFLRNLRTYKNVNNSDIVVIDEQSEKYLEIKLLFSDSLLGNNIFDIVDDMKYERGLENKIWVT